MTPLISSSKGMRENLSHARSSIPLPWNVSPRSLLASSLSSSTITFSRSTFKNPRAVMAR